MQHLVHNPQLKPVLSGISCQLKDSLLKQFLFQPFLLGIMPNLMCLFSYGKRNDVIG